MINPYNVISQQNSLTTCYYLLQVPSENNIADLTASSTAVGKLWPVAMCSPQVNFIGPWGHVKNAQKLTHRLLQYKITCAEFHQIVFDYIKFWKLEFSIDRCSIQLTINYITFIMNSIPLYLLQPIGHEVNVELAVHESVCPPLV